MAAMAMKKGVFVAGGLQGAEEEGSVRPCFPLFFSAWPTQENSLGRYVNGGGRLGMGRASRVVSDTGESTEGPSCRGSGQPEPSTDPGAALSPTTSGNAVRIRTVFPLRSTHPSFHPSVQRSSAIPSTHPSLLPFLGAAAGRIQRRESESAVSNSVLLFPAHHTYRTHCNVRIGDNDDDDDDAAQREDKSHGVGKALA